MTSRSRLRKAAHHSHLPGCPQCTFHHTTLPHFHYSSTLATTTLCLFRSSSSGEWSAGVSRHSGLRAGMSSIFPGGKLSALSTPVNTCCWSPGWWAGIIGQQGFVKIEKFVSIFKSYLWTTPGYLVWWLGTPFHWTADTR